MPLPLAMGRLWAGRWRVQGEGESSECVAQMISTQLFLASVAKSWVSVRDIEP
jgi:hypothetical protein